jgi:hypothetical protein
MMRTEKSPGGAATNAEADTTRAASRNCTTNGSRKQLSPSDIKARISVEIVLQHYGSVQDQHGRYRCLFPDRHHHGDADHSVTVKGDRAYCWAHQCLGERGADQFELVGLMEAETAFPDQKRRVLEIAGIQEPSPRQIIRRYLWADAEGREAWHLRWDTNEKQGRFTWSQSPDEQRGGKGDAALSMWRLNEVAQARLVINCAGERDAESIQGFLDELGRYEGGVATTPYTGESAVTTEVLQPLHGKSVVIVTGDNDETGRAYISKCASFLAQHVRFLHILPTPESNKDWTEWKDAGGTAKDFELRFLAAVAHRYQEEATPVPQIRLADVLDEITHLIDRYLLLPARGLSMLVAVWIANTYLYNAFQYCGYLALRSATPRCGKSRLLRLIAFLACGSPSITTTPTAAALFRSNRTVLLLDEIDRLRNADKDAYGDVMAILNTGFEKGGVVERVEKGRGGEWVVKEFQTYGPKALAGIEALADTLSDRAFMVQMQRAPSRLPRLNARRIHGQVSTLRQQMEQWALASRQAVEATYDQLPDEVEVLREFEDDRLQDISEPLIVLASLADSERPDGPAVLPRLLTGLRSAARRREPSGRERELVTVIEIIRTRLGHHDDIFIANDDLLNLCQQREELSRIETKRALANFLRHFDLWASFNSAKTQRGYTITREWVEQWQARYPEKETV